MVSCQTQQKDPSEEAIEKSFLEEITITQLQRDYRQGKYTITDVVEEYLERIAAIDQNGPMLNSIIQVNPDAMEIAEALDKEMAAGNIRGPLHGIPVILKDNIDTHDKMPTTAGSLVLQHSFPLKDSWLAKKLKESGAIIIAKSNMGEWAFSPYNTISSTHGETRNAYDLSRVPAGSSGGTASAIAANFGIIGMGSDTGNSIRGPPT